MFKTVKFQNFKSLKNFTIHLRDINVLVGPNNAGKSTVLDAFRAMSAALEFASRRLPQPLQVNNETVVGYDIPTSQIPISLTNIHSDYQTDQETLVSFTLGNGNELILQFYDNSRCILTIDSKQRTATTAQFRKNFPVSIYSFPTLGPLEEEEALLSDEYVRQSIGTRRTHRMFRNIWYRWADQFPYFQQLVEQTWEGMTISRPELTTTYPPRLSMFCKEGRVDRELCWAGFGFQVWLQILTHVANSESSNVLVVDEPEIYLHPDLQRKLFQFLKLTNKQIILATHSAEIVNEAEHDEVILINKTKRHANRVTDIDGLQDALFSIGSAQNIHLARLSRGKKILFLEGNDLRLLRRFASNLGFADFSEDINTTVVPIGGFSQRQRIQHAAWTFERVLKADIAVAALLDRDYRCPEEIAEIVHEARKTVFNFHVLAAKEIENYLLVPSAIALAANERIRERRSKIPPLSETVVRVMIEELSNELKSAVLSQYISNRMRYFHNRTSKDPATIAQEAISQLDREWKSLETRLLVVPGKQLLASLNGKLQGAYGVSITASQIIRNLVSQDVPAELTAILQHLNNFSKPLQSSAIAKSVA